MSRTRLIGTAAAVLTLALALPAGVGAQFEKVPPPAAYAIEGATVVRMDGTRLEGVNVIVRGRLIEAIGAGVATPPDAAVLPGDSVLVYPGLIDGEGAPLFEFPEIEVDREQLESWDPPRDAQGFLPQRRVVDHLEVTGESARKQRRAGVVAAAVHPGEALMPGRGAFLLLRPDAASGVEMVLDPVLGPVMAFRSARGAYPGTLFGLMAFFRQQFADAARHGRLVAAHRQDPRGMATPRWDPAYEVIRSVESGGAPVFFRADDAGDIRRALGLADELGFRVVIVGGDEAWKVADELRAADVPVLVSLDFPEPERWDPDEEPAEEAEPEPPAPPPGNGDAWAEPGGGDAAPRQEGRQEPIDPAVWREKKRLEEIYANAARLAESGVRFALTSGGGEADLREGARKAIEYGLPADAALRALTATPAAIYGAPQLARVEPGYPATLIVVDGPLFEDGSETLYSFVEGDLERFDEPREEAAEGEGEAEDAADVGGEWEIAISAEGFEASGTMTLIQEGATFHGEMALDVGGATIRDGVIDGNEIRFTVVPDDGSEVEVSGTVEGDEASGTGRQGEMSFRWTASRRPGEDR
ncbi:MAG: amidohydrolase family protein [Gemmatimonadota bacterium]